MLMNLVFGKKKKNESDKCKNAHVALICECFCVHVILMLLSEILGDGIPSSKQAGHIWNCQGCHFMFSETGGLIWNGSGALTFIFLCSMPIFK